MSGGDDDGSGKKGWRERKGEVLKGKTGQGLN